MQRLISTATIALIGWLGWLFMQGGSLPQWTLPSGQPTSNPQAGYPPSGTYQQPGQWQTTPGQLPANGTTGPYQTASSGGAAPPPQQYDTNSPTIRIASFNIQVFGNTKASKPYVMQELADIVNQFDLVAIQEIRSQNEYLIPNFVQLVNRSGRRFEHVIGPRLGITTSKEQYAYLFDSQKIEIDRQSIYTVSDPDGLLHREPLVASFRTRVDPDQAFTFTLINMHTDPDEVAKEMDVLAEVYRVVRRSGRGEDDIILLGDFNANDRQLGRLGDLPGIMPLITRVLTNTRQTKQYDNIIIHRPSTTEYAGSSGVFDFMRFKNLSLKQAIQVSDHFPVWAEFSAYERDSSGGVASRRQFSRR